MHLLCARNEDGESIREVERRTAGELFGSSRGSIARLEQSSCCHQQLWSSCLGWARTSCYSCGHEGV